MEERHLSACPRSHGGCHFDERICNGDMGKREYMVERWGGGRKQNPVVYTVETGETGGFLKGGEEPVQPTGAMLMSGPGLVPRSGSVLTCVAQVTTKPRGCQ